MKTKEQIAHDLGYRQSDSYGGMMWFKGGMFFLRLSDLPEIDKIEEIYNEQSTNKIQAVVCWFVVIVDFLTVRYVSTDFWESMLMLCLGGISAALMLQSATIWRKE